MARVSWRLGLIYVVAVSLAYGLAHAGLRLWVSSNIAIDDIKSNVYTQTLELGYVAKQPPLYEWLLWLVQRFTGPTLSSFLILKYGLLTATFAFLYLVAKRIFADPKWAMVAALSPLLLYQVGWNIHEGVTQTIVLACAVAGTTWCFMRLAERGSLGNYLMFGVAAGLGLITKYNFVAFLVVLFGSALLQSSLRARLFDWRIVASVVVAAAVTAPVAYWLITERYNLVTLYQASVTPMAETAWFKARVIGLTRALWVPFGFLFPLVVIIPVLFPATFRIAWAAIKDATNPRAWNGKEPDWRLFLLHMTFGGFIVLILGALLTGATHYLERYMHPLFLLTPLWLVGLVEQTNNAPRKLTILATVLVLATLLVVPLRIADLSRNMALECRRCRIAVPYEPLVAALQAHGFESGTIIAANREEAGNLRRFFPDARIVRIERPRYAPPKSSDDRSSKLAVVWREGRESRLPKVDRAELTRIIRSLDVKPEYVVVEPPQSTDAVKRVWKWGFIVTDSGPGE
jgi:4-amino-4-deoxy-L-arabinose transferase-like glycosyltransferase